MYISLSYFLRDAFSHMPSFHFSAGFSWAFKQLEVTTKLSTNERPTTKTFILYDKNLSNTQSVDFSANSLIGDIPKLKY